MDKIDKKIISQLQTDGRTSLEELAKNTGYTSMGTKKRLEKLTESGTIKISAQINPDALHLQPAIVMLEMESPQATQQLINRFKDCPRVVHIFKTMGGYNLIALVVAENPETLQCIAVEKCSLRSSPGIRRSEFYPISENVLSPFLPIRENLPPKEKKADQCGVDCKSCSRFGLQQCVGCPSSSDYKGTL